MGVAIHASNTQNTKFVTFSNISRKSWGIGFIFSMINIKVFYKLVSSVLVAVARHAQSSQSNFAKFFAINISIKKGGIKLIFGADKHQSFLQVDTIIFDGCDQACLNYSK